jgi:hypothetical protein
MRWGEWIRFRVEPSTLALVVAVAIAAILACSTAESPGGAPGRGVYIGSTWQSARGVTGHDKHVVELKLPCVRCHELTEDAIGAVTPARCAGCHEKEARLEHAKDQARAQFGPNAKTDCRSCHAFTLAGTGHAPVDGGLEALALDGGISLIPGPKDCNRCHATEQGGTPAVTVHGTSECVKCHRPHEDERPKPGSCDGCHEDIATTHATAGRTGIEVCTTCHDHQHAPASDARATCTECHAAHEPKVPATALFASGHTECVGCHRPHTFARKEAVECRSCHEDVRVLAAAKVPQHGRCASCHAPHDVRGSAERACAGCHQRVHPDHPKQGVAGSCVGCHDPHPAGGAGHGLARTCSACHQAAASDTDFHAAIGCKQCHKPHSFVLGKADRTVCKSCHADKVHRAQGLAGHASCEGCHGGLPHRPERLQVGCESCHAATLHTATAAHRQCTGCHEPHSGDVVKECKSCHAGEAQTAPTGHRECTKCHEQHSGSTTKSSCGSCHAKEAASAHGKLGQTCTSCHRPHGGSGSHAPPGVSTPPSCKSCHERSKLAGLHQVTQHDDCARCHSAHGNATDPARASCLGCHQDRKSHFPDAPSCASCHLFRPTR